MDGGLKSFNEWSRDVWSDARMAQGGKVVVDDGF